MTALVDIAKLTTMEYVGERVAFPHKLPTNIKIKMGISTKREERCCILCHYHTISPEC